MKGLLVYSSRTGNTEKLARAIRDVLAETHEIDLKRVEDADPKEASKYDFVLLGIWVRMTGIDKRSERFLKKLPRGTRLGIFGTSGGEHAVDDSHRLNKALADAVTGFDHIGTKLTFGKVDDKMIGKIDSIIGTLLPKKMKEYIREMSLKSREATDEERLEVANYFKQRI